MKYGFMMMLMCILLPLHSNAVTLKLSPEIELLVVDGKKVSSPLLKGAESLELEQGYHQVLFRIVKNVRDEQNKEHVYRSVPLIATFSSENITAVTIAIPPLNTLNDVHNFNKNMQYKLIDHRGNTIKNYNDDLSHLSEPTSNVSPNIVVDTSHVIFSPKPPTESLAALPHYASSH